MSCDRLVRWQRRRNVLNAGCVHRSFQQHCRRGSRLQAVAQFDRLFKEEPRSVALEFARDVDAHKFTRRATRRRCHRRKDDEPQVAFDLLAYPGPETVFERSLFLAGHVSSPAPLAAV